MSENLVKENLASANRPMCFGIEDAEPFLSNLIFTLCELNNLDSEEYSFHNKYEDGNVRLEKLLVVQRVVSKLDYEVKCLSEVVRKIQEKINSIENPLGNKRTLIAVEGKGFAFCDKAPVKGRPRGRPKKKRF